MILFTWCFLNDFNEEKANELMSTPEKWNKPFFELENGWYNVQISGGFTKQKSEYKNKNRDTIIDLDFEPTFEFIFTQKNRKSDFKANVNESFELINTN